MSGMPGPSKQPDMGPVNMAPMPPTTVRTKKRAAMATSVVAMANTASAIRKYYYFKSIDISFCFYSLLV